MRLQSSLIIIIIIIVVLFLRRLRLSCSKLQLLLCSCSCSHSRSLFTQACPIAHWCAVPFSLTASTTSIVFISCLSFCPAAYTRLHSILTVLFSVLFSLYLIFSQTPRLTNLSRLLRSCVTASESEARELPSLATSPCDFVNTAYPYCCDRAEPH